MTISLALAFLLPTLASPADWPQWNGPGFDGVSTETEWKSEGAAESLWETEVGLGYSTVSVVGGRVVTMGFDPDLDQDTVFCFDAITGEEQWRHSFTATIWNLAHEGGTVNTPSFDGERVFVLNREGNLYCLDAETGAVRWHKFLLAMGNPHELEYPRWGFSGSPTILDDGVYLNCGKLLSIERDTGKVLWASEDFGHAYGTPLAFEIEGKPALAVMNAKGLGVVDRAEGKTIGVYEMSGTQRGIHAATPVLLGDKLFVAAGTVPGCALLEMGAEGVQPVWENREMVTSFSGAVAMGGNLFGFDGKVLKCVDSTGRTLWSERGIDNGAVTGAGDRLIVMGGNGELQIVAATPAGYELQSKAELFDAGRYWTKPVLVDGVIYCRSSKGRLVARDHRM